MNFFYLYFKIFKKQPTYSGFFLEEKFMIHNRKKKNYDSRRDVSQIAILKDIRCKVYIGRENHENSK